MDDPEKKRGPYQGRENQLSHGGLERRAIGPFSRQLKDLPPSAPGAGGASITLLFFFFP